MFSLMCKNPKRGFIQAYAILTVVLVGAAVLGTYAFLNPTAPPPPPTPPHAITAKEATIKVMKEVGSKLAKFHATPVSGGCAPSVDKQPTHWRCDVLIQAASGQQACWYVEATADSKNLAITKALNEPVNTCSFLPGFKPATVRVG